MNVSTIGVSTAVGAIALTLTPLSAYSTAAERVTPMIPALAKV